MSEDTVHVQFKVNDRAAFAEWLDRVTAAEGARGAPLGYRADDYVSRRAALIAFVDAMEMKLRKNEHKKTWREQPLEAIFRLMLLELEEFKVAHEFFTPAESRGEIIDFVNFGFFLWDRLGMVRQDVPIPLQQKGQ